MSGTQIHSCTQPSVRGGRADDGGPPRPLARTRWWRSPARSTSPAAAKIQPTGWPGRRQVSRAPTPPNPAAYRPANPRMPKKPLGSRDATSPRPAAPAPPRRPPGWRPTAATLTCAPIASRSCPPRYACTVPGDVPGRSTVGCATAPRAAHSPCQDRLRAASYQAGQLLRARSLRNGLITSGMRARYAPELIQALSRPGSHRLPQSLNWADTFRTGRGPAAVAERRSERWPAEFLIDSARLTIAPTAQAD